ncbi:MAG: ATP-dependent metalloprotease FtsH, cell division protease FtsH [candidate division WS6 bacterium GW2011_GWC1_33_20]|uniref:ATP-dependent zinc metalloprotease FtsH n=1 Tax=candidate division WS6 bacterium GW2011_GWC1_33_20 TaxID=1619089 RepID=A0A0F9ZI91_9BACT|nr:MAG: ATP-dependent metalloprotease FtsH, cell division protease FtsH [candidate division WS6 bacterium GW2011_GWE2_33_157]KKP43903.1 MAG: ATP-dependent metalloprotease FtsH, cell division protease FtsH [candidate division WS6 bacterium GW2011_GWC1_33_20]KKP45911.1 MAG: ATP-dependent metalloprotease FtsH, cell division protease FtsH [candidate division WS6 bacterium GW2011_GWF1_33_233]KKP54299.1 MAG: ATP-dependent metalloprotease FtsH, cell division protease FtsH [candidate division WS6 bacter
MAENSKKDNQNANIIRIKPRKKSLSIVTIISFVAMSFLLTIGFNAILNDSSKGEEISLSQVVSYISEGKYEDVTLRDDMVIISQKGTVEGQEVLVNKFALIPQGTDFYTLLSDSGVDIKTLQNDFYKPRIGITFGDIISFIFLGAGLVLVYILIKNMQQSGGKIMDFGQSKARLLFGKKTGVTFEDVAGIEEVKEELTEIVDFLKNPKKYLNIGARIPKGVLLAGAPGTGKTLLARAVAGEAGVPFFHTSGSEFEEMLVGAGASRVRDLFTKARKASPCIIFIDEIDAVAKKRGTVLHSGAGEQTLNQILVEMDGLEGRENVIVLAATNRPDVLDPAILRPGRFDRMVVVHMPDYQGRREIMKVHAKNKKFEEGVDLDLISKKTIGYSGADLENLLNEAAIMAAKENRKKISQEDLLESYLKVKLGRKKKGQISEEDLKITAYHEAGHAIVAKFTKYATPVEQVSIIPRGMSGGVTVYLPEDDKKHIFKDELIASITSAVGGRAAEELFVGRTSTGASADIEQATSVAREMVTQYGMSEKLGMVKYGDMEETKHLGYTYGGGRDFSEKYAEMIDSEVKDLIAKSLAEAKKTLSENKRYVEKLVEMLLANEVVSKEEFDGIFTE